MDEKKQAAPEANPVATRTEMDEPWDKFEDLENRSKRNNLCFAGVPEGKESGDMTVFM